jgi:hypothetical protein
MEIDLIPLWDGEREGFRIWWTKFEAVASIEGWDKALRPEFEQELPENKDAFDDINPDKAQKQREAVHLNSKAVFALCMSLTSNRIMTKYYSSITKEYPQGVAWKAVKAILDEYLPSKYDFTVIAEYRKKLANVTMKENEDPKVLYEELCRIKNMYAYPGSFDVSEGDLVAVAIQKAPHVYRSALFQLKQKFRQKMDSNQPLKLDDVYQVMSKIYHKNIDKIKNKAGTSSGKGPKCYVCGKLGHKAAKCKQKKIVGKSNLCGKLGHRKADCWDLSANASKMPKGYNANKEVNNSSSYGVEILPGVIYL